MVVVAPREPSPPRPPRLASPDDLVAAAQAIAAASRVAVDTEFHAERRYLPRLYLVQIHVPGVGTWLVDPLEPGRLTALASALRSVPWIVHGGAQDLRLLHTALGGVPERVLDTQVAAGLIDTLFPAPFGVLVEQHLGLAIAKTATLSDWSRRPLASEQLRYASEDVELLPPLWDALERRLEALGRRAYAEAACAEARRDALEGPTAEGWREIAVASSLSPKQAAVLEELYTWREAVARADDQPPRSVLGDAVLGELARRQPATLEALAADRRMPKAVVKRLGPEIIERIARAGARPAWAWPALCLRGTASWRAAGALQTFVEAHARDARYAPRLVFPRAVAEALAVAATPDRAAVAAALGPWRDAVCGDVVSDALSGRATLRLADGDVRIDRS